MKAFSRGAVADDVEWSRVWQSSRCALAAEELQRLFATACDAACKNETARSAARA